MRSAAFSPIALLFSHPGRKSISYCFGFVPISDFYDNYARRRRDQIWLFAQRRLLRSLSLSPSVCVHKNKLRFAIHYSATHRRGLWSESVSQKSPTMADIYACDRRRLIAILIKKHAQMHTHILSHLCPASLCALCANKLAHENSAWILNNIFSARLCWINFRMCFCRRGCVHSMQHLGTRERRYREVILKSTPVTLEFCAARWKNNKCVQVSANGEIIWNFGRVRQSLKIYGARWFSGSDAVLTH
jgi:hypothetical protein